MKITILSTFMTIGAAVTMVSTAEELFNADIYLAGTNRQQLIFRQRDYIVQKKDITILTHIYTYVDGRLAAREDATLFRGEFLKYEVVMPETECGCLLVRDEGK